jgi:hypothetical protein
MPTQIRPFFPLILCMVLFSGCSRTWTGSYSSSLFIPIHQYHVVKRVTGQAKTLIVFGFGGLNHFNLVEEAKSDLIRNTKLDSNQVLGDWIVSIRTSNIWFWQRQHCEMQASVISLVPVQGAGKAGQAIAFANPPVNGTNKSRLVFPPDEILAGDTVEFFDQGKTLRGFVQEVDGNVLKIWHFNSEINANEKVYRTRREVSKWKK